MTDSVTREHRASRRITGKDHLVGAGIGFFYVCWLLATARSLGFTRDESFYFHAAQAYERWSSSLFSGDKSAFDPNAVEGMFSYNHEHPPLMKDLFGLSFEFFHHKWHLFADASTAFRFPTMCMAGVALWVTYLFGARAYGRWSGVVAAVLLGLMPRVFFNAHLACFDAPIMTMWALSIYVYWRSVQTGTLGWALLFGVVFGLTLLTKHNAWILPFVFVPHAFLVQGRSFLRQLSAGRVAIPTPIVSMVTIGPLVLLAGWPWLWKDPVGHLMGWFEFHMNHEYFNMEYLGHNYVGPPSPRSYLPVMILATVPSVTLLLFAIGAWQRADVVVRRIRSWVRRMVLLVGGEGAEAKPIVAPLWKDDPLHAPDAPHLRAHDHAQTDVLFFVGMIAPMLPWLLLPKTPIFGGTKHWLTAYPFLAVFAGRGFVLVAQAMTRAWPETTKIGKKLLDAEMKERAWLGLLAVCSIGPLLVTAHSHPFGLSSYVPLVGGTAGGADLGLNRQFWGFTTESLAPWLQKNAPRGATVYIHDTTWEAWSRLLEEHRIRPDLRAVGAPGDGELAIVHHELHMGEIDDEIWMAFGTDAPAYVLTHDGVPIISVYRRP